MSKVWFEMAKLLLDEGLADVDAAADDAQSCCWIAAMTSSDTDECISDSEEIEEESRAAIGWQSCFWNMVRMWTRRVWLLQHAMRRHDPDLMDVLRVMVQTWSFGSLWWYAPGNVRLVVFFVMLWHKIAGARSQSNLKKQRRSNID